MEKLIDIQQLRKVYTDGHTIVEALKDVNFHVKDGEFVAIMGPSGSGKSTLLSILGGLNHPSNGDVIVDGIHIYRLGHEKLADFRREYLGFVFQQHNLVPYLTVAENVMLPLSITECSNKEQTVMASHILERVGLTDKGNRLPSQLSGGEQGRAAIARALVNEPPIILTDEPTGNLDSETAAEIIDLFQELNNKGQTIIMVTHNEAYAKEANRIARIFDGKMDS